MRPTEPRRRASTRSARRSSSTRSCTGRSRPRVRSRRSTAARSACGVRTARSRRRPRETSDPGRRRSSPGPPDGSPFVVRDDVMGRRSAGRAPDRSRRSRSGTTGPGRSRSTRARRDAFDEDSVTLLVAIARHAAPAIQNAFRFLDVQELAATDLRTGLRSALAFAEELPREISAARRHGRPLCMIQVDLDDFGAINKDVLAGDRRRGTGRVRRADPRDDSRRGRRLPELRRRGRVLRDPPRHDARAGEAILRPTRVRDRRAAVRRSRDADDVGRSGRACAPTTRSRA